MPTASKPRKHRSTASREAAPGQIWIDLDALYQNCTALILSATSAAPILKDPTFIENTEHLSEITEVTKSIAIKLPQYKQQLDIIQKNAAEYRAGWDDANDKRRMASKARKLEEVANYRSSMDNIEFGALSIGEQYQSWIGMWQQDVAIDIITLLRLIELTRQSMEEKSNAAE